MNENLHTATDLQITRLEGVAAALIELAHASDYLIVRHCNVLSI